MRTATVGDIIYVAVPARFGPGKPIVGTAAFAWDMSDGFAHQTQATITTAIVGLAILAVLTLLLYLFVRASITGPAARPGAQRHRYRPGPGQRRHHSRRAAR